MRPIHLHMQGFTAFRQPTDISFKDLELFALVGATGSGKSSILDAITFALYDQTARLGSTKLEALITQGESKMLVDLTFEVGSKTYRVVRVKGRKASDSEVRFYERDQAGEWATVGDRHKKEINGYIARAVGLDYDRFTKSVLLPQGKFSELLLARGKERQELLGHLCGLDKLVEMAKRAGEKERELKTKLDTSQKLLGNEYNDLNEESVQQLRQEREQVAGLLEQLAQEREVLEQKLQRLKQWQQADLELRMMRQKVSALQASAERMRQDEAKAKAARQVAPLIPLMDFVQRSRIALEQEQTEQRALSQRHTQLAAQQAEAETRYQTAQQATTQLPELEQQAEALRAGERLLTLLRRYKVGLQHQHPAPLDWDEERYEEAKEQAAQHQKWLELSAQQQTLQQELARDEQQQPELAQALATIKEKGLAVRSKRDALQQHIEQLEQERQVKLGLQAFHQHLKVGEPCPLCGQEVQAPPVLPAKDELAERIALHRAESQQLSEQRESYMQEYFALENKLKGLEQGIDQKKQALQALAQQPVQPHPEAQTLMQRLLADLVAQVRTLGDDPAGQRQHLQERIKAIRHEYQQAQQHLSAVTAEASAQAALLLAKQQQEQRYAAEHAEATERLHTALEQSGVSEQQARAAFLPEPEIAALEASIRKHSLELGQYQEQLAQLEQKWGNVQFDPQELTQVSQTLSAHTHEQQEQQKRAGMLQEAERQMQQRLERKQALEQEVRHIYAEYQTWHVLNDTLKSTQFPKFMMTEIETRLLTTAGEILFQISDERYELMMEASEYKVRDLWNAGETRAVKTLSGGETFLASLALAVALSDYLAGNRVLGALFLDEGFGTLDPQALDAVSTALENLTRQDRMVGIVTHVASLSERMPSKIVLSKSVAGTSVFQE